MAFEQKSQNHKNTLDGVYQKRKMMLNETFSVIFKQRAFVFANFQYTFFAAWNANLQFHKSSFIAFFFQEKKGLQSKKA